MRLTPLSPVDLSFLVRSRTLNTLSKSNQLPRRRSLVEREDTRIRESLKVEQACMQSFIAEIAIKDMKMVCLYFVAFMQHAAEQDRSDSAQLPHAVMQIMHASQTSKIGDPHGRKLDSFHNASQPQLQAWKTEQNVCTKNKILCGEHAWTHV